MYCSKLKAVKRFFLEKDVRTVFVELENWKDEGEREREMYTEALMKGLIWAR